MELGAFPVRLEQVARPARAVLLDQVGELEEVLPAPQLFRERKRLARDAPYSVALLAVLVCEPLAI